jgi:hypothetical protein
MHTTSCDYVDMEVIAVTNQDKSKVTYTKEMIIKNIAHLCDMDIRTVKEVYNTLEKEIVSLLSYANPERDISIRLFEGININSTYIPEQKKLNNLTGEEIISASKIKPKVNITRYYCDKLTSSNK